MSTEIIDFKTPSKLFKLEVRGFLVFCFDRDNFILFIYLFYFTSLPLIN